MSSADALQSPLLPSSPATPANNGNLASFVTALARFEFEPGKGNDGTKVMMVEWQDDDTTRNSAGWWEVSWPGKNMKFPAGDASDKGSDNGTTRLYFMLPPGATIPPQVTIAYQPSPQDMTGLERENASEGEQQEALRIEVTPLPAIFTPELGATAKASGMKGVLHTIWAKKRLRVLEKEISNEQEFNLEGIALEMAMSEKKWIEQNFGISPQQQQQQQAQQVAKSINSIKIPSNNTPPSSPGSGLSSPHSPGAGGAGGRRLNEKLKGLSLVTKERGGVGSQQPGSSIDTPPPTTREVNPLSPEDGDMAVSSFSAFRGEPLSSSNTKSSITNAASSLSSRKVVSQAPPDFIVKAQQQEQASSSTGMGLGFSRALPAPVSMSQGDSDGGEEGDLFAKALSPRPPDEPKSPFSMSSAEVGAFAKIKGIQPASTF